MAINGGLALHLFFDRWERLDESHTVLLFVLLFASAVLIPVSVILEYLEKPKPAFIIALIASLTICYCGFFLHIRNDEIPLKTIFLYQGSSVSLAALSLGMWLYTKKLLEEAKGVVFSKTEKDGERKNPSILD